MKLQAGKTYRRRDGGLESIVRVDERFGIAYNSGGESWYLSGKRELGENDESDLISEVSNEPFTETAEQGLSVVRESETPMQIIHNGQGRFRAAIEELCDARSKEVMLSCRKLIREKVTLEKQLVEAREQRFTIDEIAEYLAGWTLASFDEVAKLGARVAHNALNQLSDDQDGIKAVRNRKERSKP